jgi:asparagine synthetase B (glutamine-hydrolysing)
LQRAIDTLTGPITLALSGGVDSALLASLLAERRDVSAVHLTSDRHPSVDEREWARAIASAHDIPLQVQVIDDEPIWLASVSSHPQFFPVTALDKLLRNHANGTLVTGLGADQLFSGTRAATLRSLSRDLDIRRWSRDVSFDRVSARATTAGLVERSDVGSAIVSLAQSVRRNRATPTGPLERREPWLKAGAWIDHQPLNEFGPLHRRWEWELVVQNAWSVGPAIHPFLCPHVWKFAASLHPRHRFHQGHDKAIVRNLLARRNPELAASIARRPKSQTFNAWALEAMLRADPPRQIPHLSRLGIGLPTTFGNRWAALQRAASRTDANWGNFHVVAMWRSFAAERWLRDTGAN